MEISVNFVEFLLSTFSSFPTRKHQLLSTTNKKFPTTISMIGIFMVKGCSLAHYRAMELHMIQIPNYFCDKLQFFQHIFNIYLQTTQVLCI